MDTDVRRPAVAGRFYTADARRLESELAQLLGPRADSPVPALALVAPHAGYVYSGRIAGATYARARIPERVVVLCPNHTGLGVRRSIWTRGAWQLPGGAVPVDDELAEIVTRHARLTPDHAAHLREHAIEVHLPFLRALQPHVRIVPICLAGLSLAECHEVGAGLAHAIEQVGSRATLIVASTDMSHYVAADVARRLDQLALERVVALDPDGLYEVVTQQDISMCGYIPTTVALLAARTLGASAAELVRYGNSGEVSGDLEQVVGYAGVIVS